MSDYSNLESEKTVVSNHYDEKCENKCLLSAEERYKELDKLIKKEIIDNFKFANRLSSTLLIWNIVGAAAAAGAVIAAILPDQINVFGHENVIYKWTAALPAAMSGACFLFLRQGRYSERVNAHFYRHDLMRTLYLEMTLELSSEPTLEEIRNISAKYREYLIKTGEIFAKINLSFSMHMPHEDN